MAHSGFDKLTDRLRNVLSRDEDDDIFNNSNNIVNKDKNVNKPDFREVDLGSPVSPLRPTRPVKLGGAHTTSGTATTTTTTTTTSSSSSSSGSVSGCNKSGLISGSAHSNLSKRSDCNTHSGEHSGSAESSPSGPRGGSSSGGSGPSRPGHVRSNSSGSHSLIYPVGGGGGSSTVNSPPVNVLPTGNICRSGKILKAGMMSNRTTKTDVLGSGTGNYGHGSIIRGGAATVRGVVDGGTHCSSSSRGGLLMMGGDVAKRTTMRNVNDPEEFKRAGNENYKKGNFSEAISLYDKAIAISPGNAAYHFNRAAALMGLNRLPEAAKECEEAIRLDPRYLRAHHRLGSLFLSLGQVENARRHFCSPGCPTDSVELQKLEAVEKHLSKCTDARRVADWITVLRETDGAIASGADSSPLLFACRSEALLKLHQLGDAVRNFSSMPKFEMDTGFYSQSMYFGMHCEAYPFFVGAQIELAQGRFDNALIAAEKAAQIDARNVEVSVLLKNVRLVGRARARGNDLFKSERFTEACAAYAEGLKLDPSNSVLYCNRAACWYKLGQWERSLDDCSQALRLQPNYTKALLRRAASNSKLERWAEAVRDYEVLRKELPYDNEIAEQLFHAHVALKKSRGEEVYNMKFGGEVELLSGLEQFRAAISSPSASVVHFKAATNDCEQISPFLDTLCTRYPSINFLKVDVDESPAIANAENVRVVPTFKIYKKGRRVKEMICPSPEVLEASVRHYSI